MRKKGSEKRPSPCCPSDTCVTAAPSRKGRVYGRGHSKGGSSAVDGAPARSAGAGVGARSVLPWGATPDLCPQPSEGAGPTAGLRVGRPSAAPCFCFIILEYFFTRSVIFQQVRRSVLVWRVRAARGRDAVRRSCRTHSFPVAPRGCALASCWVLEVFLTYM